MVGGRRGHLRCGAICAQLPRGARGDGCYTSLGRDVGDSLGGKSNDRVEKVKR